MSKTIIKVENLGKKYTLGEKQNFYTLRDSITGMFSGKKKAEEEFWALKDVNFEIKQGESVGIIGRNGAGKSTLLKILSQITPPTTGKITMSGRVASLLEVGTGFHQELTGRENIFLNGAILGMSREEVRRKFDEIVAFSEVEKFLDMPVKHYSSGMYMRLAFAVAAHLESEILIVDEVLAVGDAQFQKKCLEKMSSVTENEDRTILFVSHNMNAIKQLCKKSILLSNGNILDYGKSSKIVQRYNNDENGANDIGDVKKEIVSALADKVIRIEDLVLSQSKINLSNFVVENGKELEIEVKFSIFQAVVGLRIFIDLYDNDGILLFRSFNDELGNGNPNSKPGLYISKAIIPKDLLSPTTYILKIFSTIHNVRYCEPKSGISIKLTVDRTGKVNRAYMSEPIRGKLAPFINWRTRLINEI